MALHLFLMQKYDRMNFNFKKDIFIESNELFLRPLLLTDIENLLDIATADKTLLQYSPKQIFTKELLTEYIKAALELRDQETRYTFIIFSKSDNCYIGSSAFLNVSKVDDRIEIGATWLGKAFQGRELNTKCKYLLLDYLFETIKAHRVELKTDERNIQSRKAIEKIGGKFEGILREHTLMSDGFRRNTICYSILKSEWDLIKIDLFTKENK